MKVKTYAPAFIGFYNTIWDIDTDDYTDENEVSIPYERLEIDWEGYRNEIGRRYCRELPELFPLGMISNVEYECIISPREYNFKTDSINCTIDIDTDELCDYLDDNWESFKDFIKETYTSRDGFISWHSAYADDWRDQTSNFTVWEDTHKLGGVLDFVAQHYNEGENLTTLMYEYTNKHEVDYSYITVKRYTFDELSTEELTQAIINNAEEIDFDYGYGRLIVEEAKHRAEIFGTQWQAELEDKDKINFLSSAGITAEEIKQSLNTK